MNATSKIIQGRESNFLCCFAEQISQMCLTIAKSPFQCKKVTLKNPFSA